MTDEQQVRGKTGARWQLVLALITAFGGGQAYWHRYDEEAQRDRYENLQMHCIERQIDHMRAAR